MSWQDMLNHTCDIYHLRKGSKTVGYGIRSSGQFTYEKTPDECGVPCHFATGGTLNISQAEPQAVLNAAVKLSLPIDTDVRLNDKVVDCESGIEYTAGVPRQVRNHHIIVLLRRTEKQEAL